MREGSRTNGAPVRPGPAAERCALARPAVSQPGGDPAAPIGSRAASTAASERGGSASRGGSTAGLGSRSCVALGGAAWPLAARNRGLAQKSLGGEPAGQKQRGPRRCAALAEVYDKVSQSKFIPIACELDEKGEPYMPVFFQTRIWFSFSSAEAVNENREGLIRLVYDKPLLEKPQLGKAPAYITDEKPLPNEAFWGKLSVLRQAVQHGQRGLKGYRRDFFDAVLAYIDDLRVRAALEDAEVAEMIVETFRKLVPARDAIVDWVLMEGEANVDGFEDALLHLLERLLSVKGPPKGTGTYQDRWFDGHEVFIYQTFLYIVAALVRCEGYQALHTVLFGHYLFPEDQRRSGKEFGAFDEFYGFTESINSALTTENKRYYSQAAELIARNVQRADTPFNSLMEADGLCFLAGLIQSDTRWFPQTFYYIGYRSMTFFVRAAQKRHFAKLAAIMGVGGVAELKQKVEAGLKRTGAENWFPPFQTSMIRVLNYDAWDTLS